MSRRKFYEVDLQDLREALEQELSELGGDDDLPAGMFEMDHADEGAHDADEGAHDADEGAHDADEAAHLDELINELKLAIDLGDDIEADELPEELRGMILADDEEGEEEVDLEDAEEPAFDFPGADEEGEEEGEEPAGEEEAEEANETMTYEVDEEMLAEELYRMRMMLNEANDFGGKGGDAGVDGAYGGKGKKNAGVLGAFGGGSGQDAFTNPPASLKKINEALRKQRRMNRALNEKLNKYRGAVETLREQLEDLNLFNAKLLYVNKLLQNKSLKESEKKSIIKALDEAKTLSETKSLYQSLTETYARGSRKSLTESRRYSSSSKTTTSSASATQAGELDRWQTLAGLK